MGPSRFSQEVVAEGKALIKAGKVGQVLFSEGTYQLEILDPRQKGGYWPFIQLNDSGDIIDCFCSCSHAEQEGVCEHLAAAYQSVFGKHLAPLHVRFRSSLWNLLCLIASRRHGYQGTILKGNKGGYEATSATNKCLFLIEGITPDAKKKLHEIIFQRVIETEETSLKFSNLPPEEITLWRAGRPSSQLQYELSFWSDIAKWLMLMQEREEPYEISFTEDREGLPRWIQVKFSFLLVGFYIAEVNWPSLVPSLSTVSSPLIVDESAHYQIEEILYDIERRAFLVVHSEHQQDVKSVKEKGLEVGDWIFVPKKGFFSNAVDPIFQQEEISRDKIGSVLGKHGMIVQKFLKNEKIHFSRVKAQYSITFDEHANLHICSYLFEKGDLQKLDSAYFGSWVYLSKKGFYPLENPLFDGVEKVIFKDKVSEFINNHRVWLGGFQGFHTHIYTIESQLHFTLSKEGILRFDASLETMEAGNEVIDFGEWVYLAGKGFFAKRVGRGGIIPGTVVGPSEISRFIRVHRGELDQLSGFFSQKNPLEQGGLNVSLNEEGRIVIRPSFRYALGYGESNVKIFGDYVFVIGEGFYEIAREKRVPEPYTQEHVIPLLDEPHFVLYELEGLRPFITSIDSKLETPQELHLEVIQFLKAEKQGTTDWLLEANFVTEKGKVDLFSVWQAVVSNKKYLFSSAGLLYLKNPRFSWLKGISKRQWSKQGKRVRLSMLEWLRLTVFEELHLPGGGTPAEQKTCSLVNELMTFHSDQPIDLKGFKSDLRTYQELGVKWLWFLYLHGLSGLLCDEMGLGKTHQAMGIIAAVSNLERGQRKKKILVVCPTSVIYHWEELLQKFLPELQVLVFYGISRSLDTFEEGMDLLLTSYGTLRSEKDLLSKIFFEIAVFDELQTAKNAHSQTHKALKKLQTRMRVGLTGTPIENSLLELKALFDLIVPGYFPQEAHFKQMFVNPIEKGQDLEKKSLLSRLIKPFILRRKKSEVLLELPEKIEEIAYCDLSQEQWEMYRKTFTQHKESLLIDFKKDDESVPLVHIFSLLSTLKQICNHPCLITKDYQDFYKHRSGKWDLLVALLQEIRDSGQKVVIFSQYLEMLDMIESYLKEHRIGYAGIRGATRNRKEQLQQFRDDPKCEVFLASLQAVGVGVDLVSASVVIHYDRWWNPARENQATDRVHRIGQRRGVQVFKMVTKGTIEEHIHRLIEKKLALAQGVIGFDDQDQIKGLDREEVMKLLLLIEKDLY